MNVFYSSDIVRDKITLRDQEAHHCSNVLRKKRGGEVLVIDGRGTKFQCEVEEVQKQTVLLSIIAQEHKDPDPNLPHLAFGLLKNNTRLEILLEKITEIGVARITPLICARSERSKIKTERLEKILISAMKQSLNYFLPILDEPLNFADFLLTQERTNKFIASYGDGIPELSSDPTRHERPVMLIGPEGDFANEEIELARKAGFKRVNLGKNRLRAETAAIVACTILRY